MSAGTLDSAEIRAECMELESLLVARSYLYTLFHKLLGAAPDAEVLDVLLGEETADVVDEYAADDVTMSGLGRFLAECAAREDRENLLDAARDEYTRLFVGPAALPAPTWESPYRTGEATLFQENTLAVRAAYHSHGLQPKRLQRIPDDHVALMCGFMATVTQESLAALRYGQMDTLASGLRDQLAFASAHLIGWLDRFAAAVRTSNTAVLYPQLLEALAAFTAADATFMTEAAFWAEGLMGNEAGGSSGVASTTNRLEVCSQLESPVAAALAKVGDALAALEAARPFGIEDNELVPVPQGA